MPGSLEDQLKWCGRARDILAKTGKKDKAALKFDSELLKVKVKLERLIELAGETPVVKDFLVKLDEIGRQAQGLDESAPKYKAKNGKELLRNDAKAITAQLQTLGKSIDDSKPAKALAEARERLFNTVELARDRLKALTSQPEADTPAIEHQLTILDNAEESVRRESRYQDPAECNKLNNLISTTVGPETLRLEQEAKGLSKKDVGQSRDKPLVQDRVRAAERLQMDCMANGEISPELQQRLKEKLEAIAVSTAQDKWTEALVLAKGLPTAGEVRKDFLLSQGKLRTNFRAELEECDKLLVSLGRVMDDASLEKERADYNQLLSKGGGDPSVSEIAKLRNEMKTLQERWQQRTTELGTAQTTLTQHIEARELRVTTLYGMVPITLREENDRQLETLRSLKEQKLFETGIEAAQALKKSLDKQEHYKDDNQAWVTVAGNAEGFVTQLKKLATNPGLAPKLQEDAARLAKTLSPEGIAKRRESRSWADLLQAYREADIFIKSSGSNAEKFKDFEGKRTELGKAMEPEWTKLTQALTTFESAARVAKADPVPLLTGSRKKLEALQADWKLWLSNATADTDQARVEEVKREIAALVGEIQKLGDAKTLEAEAKNQAEQAGHERFNTAKSNFTTTELAALITIDALKGAALRKRLEALETQEPSGGGDPWAARIEGVKALVLEATTATSQAPQLLKTKNDTLVLAVAEQERQIAALRVSMKTKKLDLKTFAPLLDGLDTDLANLKVLTTTENMSAAEVNERLLGTLTQRVENLQTLVEHGSTFEDYTVGLTRNENVLEGLKGDGLAKVLPDTMSALQEQLDALKADLYGMDPADAGKAMGGLELAMATARTELNKSIELKSQVKILASECSRGISEFKKTKKAEVYRKSLESRVSTAKNRPGTASDLNTSVKELTDIKAELEEVKTNPDVALRREKTVLTEKQSDEKLKNEWKSRLSVVKGSVMARLNKALEGGGDKGQKEEVENMIAMAEKAVSDGKDYERGLRVLNQTEGRVVQIERNPEGTALGDRKSLPKHMETYAANVRQLREAMEGFVGQAAALVDEPTRKTALQDALKKLVAPLALRLDPLLFAVPVQKLQDDNLKAPQRREARELALARVRESVDFLNNHPTMAALLANPIVPLKADKDVVITALNRLEAHVRAAVR